MHVSHHRGDPAHVVVATQRAGLASQQLGDVTLHRRFPVALVGHVDGEFLGGFRHLDVVVGEHEAAQFAIQGEALDAITQGQHQHGLRAVDGITGTDLLGARLQEGFLAQVTGLAIALGAAQHGEDGADRNVDVDVAGAVQRVEYQQVGTFRVLAGDLVGVVHFLGGHAGQVAAPLVGFEQDLVGDHVELLLHLALYVLAVQAAQHAAEGAFGHLVADGLASPCHNFDKEAQISRRVMAASLFDQVAAEGDAGHGQLRIGKNCAQFNPSRRALLPAGMDGGCPPPAAGSRRDCARHVWPRTRRHRRLAATHPVAAPAAANRQGRQTG